MLLSPRSYNEVASLAVLCPITAAVKGYPFEVLLPTTCPVSGVVLATKYGVWIGVPAVHDLRFKPRCRWYVT